MPRLQAVGGGGIRQRQREGSRGGIISYASGGRGQIEEEGSDRGRGQTQVEGGVR